MKSIICFVFWISLISGIKAQHLFYKTLDLEANEAVYQLVEYKGRFFVSITTVCNFTNECATVMEIDDQANIIWSKNLPFLDVSSKTMLIENDTITVTGNNLHNDKFVLHQMNIDGGDSLSTYFIEHPTIKFTNMFVQSINRYNNNFVLAGAGRRNDSVSSLLYIVRPKGMLDSLIITETTKFISLIWDAYIGRDGLYTAFYYLDEYTYKINYRKVVKYDSNFNTVWSYTSDSLIRNESYIKGCELLDGRIAFVYGHPKLSSGLNSVRCVNLDSTISWQYDWKSTATWKRKIRRLKVLRNGDILGSGEYAATVGSFRVDGSGFMFRLDSDGKLLWEHAYVEVAPDGEDKGGNLWDFQELSDGSILAVGFVWNKDWDLLFIRTGADGCIIQNNCYEVSVLTETTIPEYIEDMIIIPNPGFDQINISLSDDMALPIRYELNSISGQRIEIGNHSGGSTLTISASKLDAGMYFITLMVRAAKIWTGKWVKE
ncbi:MAG: T9SS type A sorting domain-containing protein [Saprospiraceae bacterium]|nr:T9SS type A sorting domain-containing protein [Saprospiraceae bacterium]